MKFEATYEAVAFTNQRDAAEFRTEDQALFADVLAKANLQLPSGATKVVRVYGESDENQTQHDAKIFVGVVLEVEAGSEDDVPFEGPEAFLTPFFDLIHKQLNVPEMDGENWELLSADEISSVPA